MLETPLCELCHTLAAGKIKGLLISGQQQLSFRELALHAQSIELPGPAAGRLALLAKPELDFVVLLLACWLRGSLPLILNPAEWFLKSHSQQIEWLNHLGAAACYLGPDWQTTTSLGSMRQMVDMSSPSAALVLFTSGSSGQQKGVMLSHSQVLNNITAVKQDMNLSRPARVGIMLPLYHSFALITQLLLGLSTGGELHLLNPAMLPGERLDYFQTHRLEQLAGVPTHFQMLLLSPTSKMQSLRHLQVAGAALPLSLAEQLCNACPEAEVWVGYGLTEAGPRVSALAHTDPAFWQGSAGKAIQHTHIKILADEIWVKSPSLMLGYLDDPVQSALTLKQGWLKTGDCGYLDADYLYITGRADALLNVAGEKVSPLEIEAVLLSHPAVQAAAVYGQSDPVLGQKIVALLQLSQEPTAKPGLLRQELQLYCQQHLPAAKCPQIWKQTAALPLTANGKLKRKELPTWPQTPLT